MSGASFGDYRLVRLLTQGRRAEVYLALNEHNPDLPREVTLMKLLSEGSGPAREHPRLPSPDSPSWQLDHPNIPRVLGQGQVGDSPFVLTEFVDGPDLDKVLSASRHKQLPLPHSLVYYLAGEVVAALAYAEATTDKTEAGRRLVHRDISPAVVLLSYDGAVKLDRLELALDPDSPGPAPLPAFARSAYMSPEQVRGEQLNSASDIFSFGILLYEMMTGAHPFARDEDHQSRQAVLAGRVPSPATLRPSLAAGLVALVERCLCPDPKDRYPTARSLQDAITEEASRASEVGDSEALTDFLRLLFPAQMARRPGQPEDSTVPIPATQDAAPVPIPATRDATPVPVPATRAAAPVSAEDMTISTGEFETSLADPRRVRLMGRPDAVPPTPPALGPPPSWTEAEHREAEADPFQLGALLESGDDHAAVSLPEAPTVAPGPKPVSPPPDTARAASSTGRPSRLGLWPLGAALSVLAMVVVLGGPSPELSKGLLVPPLSIALTDPVSETPETAGETAGETTGETAEEAAEETAEEAAEEAAEKAAEERNQVGTLIVHSSPWAYVSIDGVLREWMTPTRLVLPSGTHVIGLFHPASNWRAERTVVIQTGQELTLSINR